MAVIYSKTTFDEYECSKLKDVLVQSRKAITDSIPELAEEWYDVLNAFLNDLEHAKSITIECDYQRGIG